MGISLGFEIFLLIVFIVLHAFFALAETSILNVRRSRLKEMVDDEEVDPDDRVTASRLLELKHNVESFVATMQCGAVLSSFLVATMAALIAYNDLSPSLAISLGWTLRTGTIVAFILAIAGGVIL